MNYDITPRNIQLDGITYMVDGYSIYKHVRYANAYRRHYWSMIAVENDELRRELASKI